MVRESHYESQQSSFLFLQSPGSPDWRTPQVGAISATVARWSLDPTERLLLSMPTGSGKTGVATALPYLAAAHRVLVVVPSTELRSQMVAAFRNEDVLRKIGAVGSSLRPIVEIVKGRKVDWKQLESADVVVALPNSISPIHFSDGEIPDPNFFDLVIVDEAHHAPSRTWRAILEHFANARAVLLTATPRRADGKALPGSHIFHYPLRRAMTDGIYQAISPMILEPDASSTMESRDRMIAEAVVRISKEPDHATSAILTRAGSVARAEKLRTLYANLGFDAEIVNSKVPASELELIIEKWRRGDLRAVITVDMLVEGFDLPNLRIVGYHDKHKSVPVTMQFIGRLARASSEHPQRSVLVTARDQDIYPALQGALRALYDEDADWAEILPGLIDDDIQAKKLDAEYLSAFDDAPPSVSLAAMMPLARVVIFEAPKFAEWEPSFCNGEVPDELRPGVVFASQTVAYSSLNQRSNQLIVLTSHLETPRWYQGDMGLTRPVFDLHAISWHKAARTDRRDLLFVNSHDRKMTTAFLELLDPRGVLRNANPGHLQEAFDSLERFSVSSVGVRNTFASTPGTPAYAMFAGRGIDRGLRDADTSSKALGHAMAQVESASGTTVTAGLATSKGKYWETRYLGLRDYEAFTIELAGRYWYPRATTSGPLLPNVAKGVRTESFPEGTEVVAAELNPSLFGHGWQLPDGQSLEMLDIAAMPNEQISQSSIHLALMDPANGDEPVWTGFQDIHGRFTSKTGDVILSRGAGQIMAIDELLTLNPPTVYLLDGNTIFGGMTYLPVGNEIFLPPIHYEKVDWSTTDIKKESKAAGRTDTIHDLVEQELTASAANPGAQRWVLCNDGPGEIADHLVIELPQQGRPRLELWHSKYSATASPSVRVDDMQIVTQQAAKSRRHFTDRDFWNRIGRRLTGKEQPPLRFVSGNEEDLFAVCGLLPSRTDESLAFRAPSLECQVVVVQPGLSLSKLDADLHAGTLSAGQVREFLIFLHNAVAGIAEVRLIASA